MAEPRGGGHEPDGRLVRRVRWQLIGWSAGSTLAVLLVLGGAIYLAVARSLAAGSEDLLRGRAALLVSAASSSAIALPSGIGTIDGGTTIGTAMIVSGSDAGLLGLAVDGPYAGTLAVLVVASGAVEGVPAVVDAPDPEGYAAAAAGITVLRETAYLGNPSRVLSIPVSLVGAPSGTSPDVIQIVGDRSTEMRTLATLLTVLVGGGILALGVATALGSLYATRALVPIRSSLRRQREFAADTSHELRTPLAVIRASVARLRQQPDVSIGAASATLDAVDAEAVRLASLVDDLLALARTDAGTADLDLADLDLADIATDALAALEPLATTRGTELALDVAPAPMRGDADRLRRLVSVLVDNAIRHGHDGGHVQVTVRAGRLVVEDDGPGIAAADRPRAFDRFWRGAAAGPGGSGLGLAIAAWVVERHGGRIALSESALGGARFEVTLPAG